MSVHRGPHLHKALQTLPSGSGFSRFTAAGVLVHAALRLLGESASQEVPSDRVPLRLQTRWPCGLVPEDSGNDQLLTYQHGTRQVC